VTLTGRTSTKRIRVLSRYLDELYLSSIPTATHQHRFAPSALLLISNFVHYFHPPFSIQHLILRLAPRSSYTLALILVEVCTLCLPLPYAPSVPSLEVLVSLSAALFWCFGSNTRLDLEILGSLLFYVHYHSPHNSNILFGRRLPKLLVFVYCLTKLN
jgi:hypothetical protein